MNYLSLWIANLGVVPWLLFLFFLFLPMFLALIALLVLVCCVLEAISYPFDKLFKIRTDFLSLWTHLVKIFLITFMGLGSLSKANTLKTHDYFLSKGEQVEISTPKLASFSVGNKEVLRTKFYESQGKLLAKGLSLGFSDVVVWEKSGEKKTLRFYVVSKRDQLETFQLANDFKSLGLHVKATAFELLVEGTIKDKKSLKLFHRSWSKNQGKVISLVKLSKALRNEIIIELYKKLSPLSEALVCDSKGVELTCLQMGLGLSHPEVVSLTKAYPIKFISINDQYNESNFKIELKVYRADNSFLQKAGIGLDSLSSKVQDFLNNGKDVLIENNLINLSNNEITSKIITGPSLVTSIGSEGEVQLGAEIPVNNQNQYGSQYTTWKFAGLKLKTLLSRKGSRFSLNANTELTYPSQEFIKGSKSNNQFFIGLGKYVQAFQVKYQVNSNGAKAVPGISRIPLLGKLFSSSSTNNSDQYLVGFIKVSRLP